MNAVRPERHRTPPAGCAKESAAAGLSALGALLLALALSGCGRPSAPGGRSTTGESSVVSNHLAAIVAAGDPITLQALDRMYALPPAGEDATPLYEEAFAALNGEDAKSPTLLAHNQKAVGLLLKAAERKGCRYPVALGDGFNAKLPHLAKVRTCATLLQQEAVSQAGKGRADAASAAILAGVRLARSLDNEPLLISKLVQVRSLGQAFEALEQALTRKAFTEAQLLNLQTALDETEPGIAFRRAMVGERANLVALFQSPDERLSETMVAFGGGSGSGTDLQAYRKTVDFQQDFAFTLGFMSNLVAAADLPYPQALDALADNKVPDPKTAAQGKLKLSAMLLPAATGVFHKAAESVARIRIARTTLAVERYRAKHDGKLPGSLTDLAAELPEGTPQDPFDGQSLRYKRLPGRGYAVYSIGRDRQDDGGNANSADSSKPPADVVMTVAR